MTVTVIDPPTAAALRARLDKGAPLLWDIETGATPKPADYDTWLRGYEDLIADYEAACDREEMAHAKD